MAIATFVTFKLAKVSHLLISSSCLVSYFGTSSNTTSFWIKSLATKEVHKENLYLSPIAQFQPSLQGISLCLGHNKDKFATIQKIL